MNGFVELWHNSIHVVNLPATLLLGLVVLYWFTVILGVLDLSSLDMDIPDVDGEIGVDGGGHPGFDALLEYLNIRHVPISIVVSFFALSLWVTGVSANQALHDTQSGALGTVVFVLNCVFSAHVAKWVTAPMKPLFQSLRRDAEGERDLTGTRVVVVSSKADAGFGVAEIPCEGAPITLNVRTEGVELPKGSEAVILQYQPEKNIYIITPLEL